MASMKQVLLFYDDVAGVVQLSSYLNARFDPTLRHLHPVRHYHSKMSPDYLTKTFDEFSKGEFKILVATDGASTVSVSIH